MVMIVMIVVFTFVGQTESSWMRMLIKFLSMPLIAGITYEFTRWSARHCEWLPVRAVTAPGLWLQKLTTEEPDESQLEVAIAALKTVLAPADKESIPDEEENSDVRENCQA